jgi:hypothetical protein
MTNLIKFFSRPFLLLENHIQRGKEDDQAMSDITKHHGEQEGERNDSKQTRVDFLIGRNTISVHNGLEALGELVGASECWWRLVRAQLMQDRHDTRTRFLLQLDA